MALQSKGNRYDRYPRRETSGARFLRYALMGVCIGDGVGFCRGVFVV